MRATTTRPRIASEIHTELSAANDRRMSSRLQTGITSSNGTAVATTLSKEQRPQPIPLSQDAAVRERCTLLGIEWLEKAPPSDPAAAELLPPEIAVRLGAVPVSLDGGRIVVAMLDPLDTAAVDEISTVTAHVVRRIGLDPPAFRDLMRDRYGTTAARMAETLASDGGLTASPDDEHNLDAIEADDVHRMAEQPTLINLVNLILLEAIQGRASDVHVEPFEIELRVKYRIDGVLVSQPQPPKHLQAALIGRVKIMAGMNIAERYVPQDGHITLRFEGRKVDIRVSTVPTLYGESVVMRILDKSSLPLDLVSLGMSESHRLLVDRMIDKPHGLVLVTGPTGSGKTTTLYAALSKLYDPRKKIITIEDPVEYELNGINQIPVNAKRGLSFATGLRAILRQDPDIVFVGEVRDSETVDIAIRSALTGHLIFSTLHTNDAISSVGRLADMGAEPYLTASVLEGLIAQRLGRRNCAFCRESRQITEEVDHRLTPEERVRFVGKQTVGRGCEKCNGSGFRGRLGFFEIVRITAALRAAIAQNRPVHELKALLDSEFISMREDGMRKAVAGMTTIEEVLRATQDVEDFSAELKAGVAAASKG
ncbi:MAG: type II/IV secretion system protein [Planctomycetota bacterium]|nr:MAG: type II/IV secretion system protein [Planctomycetota bacterium]RLS95888.1 MAG: type II/IV secretion system protein [Planctomycetota bacterium]